MLRFDVHGCTDVSGFGLLGHARELAAASGVTVEIAVGRVQFLPGAVDYAREGAIPAGLKNNREFVACAVAGEAELPRDVADLLYDPQTSGGLLISLSEPDAAALERAMPEAYRLGRVIERQDKAVRLV
jgi:selenide,water dikinase